MNIWRGGRRQLNKEDEALNQKEQTWRTPGGRAGAEDKWHLPCWPLDI